jgi:hypothetical protein
MFLTNFSLTATKENFSDNTMTLSSIPNFTTTAVAESCHINIPTAPVDMWMMTTTTTTNGQLFVELPSSSSSSNFLVMPANFTR